MNENYYNEVKQVNIFNYNISKNSLGKVRIEKETSIDSFMQQIITSKYTELKQSYKIIYKNVQGICYDVDSATFDHIKQSIIEIDIENVGFFIIEEVNGQGSFKEEKELNDIKSVDCFNTGKEFDE